MSTPSMEVKESLVWKTAPSVGMVGRMYIPETEEEVRYVSSLQRLSAWSILLS